MNLPEIYFGLAGEFPCSSRVPSSIFTDVLITASLLRSRYLGRHATLLPHYCVTTQITAAEETKLLPAQLQTMAFSLSLPVSSNLSDTGYSTILTQNLGLKDET